MSRSEEFQAGRLGAAEFMQAFKPSEYGQDWDEVEGSPEYGAGIGRWGGSALRDSLAKEGMTSPVLVHDSGRVVDGHHRVIEASRLGIQIPFEKTSHWLYEGQGS